MKAEDLFRAIGQAEPADLEHSEKQIKKHRSMLPRVALIAAVIAALCMTAMAIPSVRNLLLGVKVQQNRLAAITVVDGAESVANGSADVRMEITLPQDAPAVIENAYVPLFAAEHWQPIPEYRTEVKTEQVPSEIYLAWEDGKGNYAYFRQLACPRYAGDYTVETVDLGFNAAYTIRTLQLGEDAVQCVAVEPSTVDGEGVQAKDDGRQKLFWSDGSYLFSMEVNYGMSDIMLQQLYESITQVESIEQYRKIIPVPAAPTEHSAVENPYFPSFLPEGWVLTEGGLQPDGSYLYLFNPEYEDHTASVLQYTQSCGKDDYLNAQSDWAAEVSAHTTRQIRIGDTAATVFCAANENGLLWQTEDGTFRLVSEGPNCLTADQLTEIALSLKP